jgi:hypothetical protein
MFGGARRWNEAGDRDNLRGLTARPTRNDERGACRHSHEQSTTVFTAELAAGLEQAADLFDDLIIDISSGKLCDPQFRLLAQE